MLVINDNLPLANSKRKADGYLTLKGRWSLVYRVVECSSFGSLSSAVTLGKVGRLFGSPFQGKIPKLRHPVINYRL